MDDEESNSESTRRSDQVSKSTTKSQAPSTHRKFKTTHDYMAAFEEWIISEANPNPNKSSESPHIEEAATKPLDSSSKSPAVGGLRSDEAPSLKSLMENPGPSTSEWVEKGLGEEASTDVTLRGSALSKAVRDSWHVDDDPQIPKVVVHGPDLREENSAAPTHCCSEGICTTNRADDEVPLNADFLGICTTNRADDEVPLNADFRPLKKKKMARG